MLARIVQRRDAELGVVRAVGTRAQERDQTVRAALGVEQPTERLERGRMVRTLCERGFVPRDRVVDAAPALDELGDAQQHVGSLGAASDPRTMLEELDLTIASTVLRREALRLGEGLGVPRIEIESFRERGVGALVVSQALLCERRDFAEQRDPLGLLRAALHASREEIEQRGGVAIVPLERDLQVEELDVVRRFRRQSGGERTQGLGHRADAKPEIGERQHGASSIGERRKRARFPFEQTCELVVAAGRGEATLDCGTRLGVRGVDPADGGVRIERAVRVPELVREDDGFSECLESVGRAPCFVVTDTEEQAAKRVVLLASSLDIDERVDRRTVRGLASQQLVPVRRDALDVAGLARGVE